MFLPKYIQNFGKLWQRGLNRCHLHPEDRINKNTPGDKYSAIRKLPHSNTFHRLFGNHVHYNYARQRRQSSSRWKFIPRPPRLLLSLLPPGLLPVSGPEAKSAERRKGRKAVFTCRGHGTRRAACCPKDMKSRAIKGAVAVAGKSFAARIRRTLLREHSKQIQKAALPRASVAKNGYDRSPVIYYNYVIKRGITSRDTTQLLAAKCARTTKPLSVLSRFVVTGVGNTRLYLGFDRLARDDCNGG